jgi:hypothetical protein
MKVSNHFNNLGFGLTRNSNCGFDLVSGLVYSQPLSAFKKPSETKLGLSLVNDMVLKTSNSHHVATGTTAIQRPNVEQTKIESSVKKVNKLFGDKP